MSEPVKNPTASDPSMNENVENAAILPHVTTEQDDDDDNDATSTSASWSAELTRVNAMVESMELHSSETGEEDEYPSSWVYDPENPEAHLEAFFRDQREIGKEMKERGMPAAPEVIYDDTDGKLKLRPHLIPAPRPNEKDDPNTEYVCMIKKVQPEEPTSSKAGKMAIGKETSEGKEREIRIVAEDKVRELEEQGWTVWLPPTAAYDITKGYEDVRKCTFSSDVNTNDNPVADTNLFLGKANESAAATMSDGKWRPGQLLGSGGDDPEVQAKSPPLAGFTRVRDMTEVRSATSTGHVQDFTRPSGVGVGWGGYDDFNVSQSYGRRIPEESVEEREWQTDVTAPVTAVSDSGRVMTWEVRSTVGMPPGKKEPIPLKKAIEISKSSRRDDDDDEL